MVHTIPDLDAQQIVGISECKSAEEHHTLSETGGVWQ